MSLDVVDPATVGMSRERLGWARDLVAAHVGSGRAPSAVALVMRRGRAVLAEAFGVRGPHGAPLQLDDVWAIASVGKPLTAAALMTLVEEGRVGIHQPAAEYLPEFAALGDRSVLVHHLLTHTTGWESAQRNDRLIAEAWTDPPPGRDFLTHLMLSLAGEPVVRSAAGEQMDYDTASFELVAEIVRRQTGGTLDAALRARIFGPLGMTRSAAIVGADLRPHLVTRPPGVPLGPGSPIKFEGELWESSDCGGATIYASAPDLARFAQMILNGGELDGVRVLSTAAVRSMVTNQIPGVPALFGPGTIPEGSWGYGFTVLSTLPFPYFTGGLVPPGSALHPGAGGASFWIDFEHGIVGVLFEVATELDEFNVPVSGITHRFQDVVTAAVTA